MCGAADRIRTGDLLLGKETFYQLNYHRRFYYYINKLCLWCVFCVCRFLCDGN